MLRELHSPIQKLSAPTPLPKSKKTDPHRTPPPTKGPAFYRMVQANNPLKRSARQAPPEGYPNEDEKTVTMVTVSGEEITFEKGCGFPWWGCFKCSQIAAASTGDELPAHKIPLQGRLDGSTQGVSGESELFYKNIKRFNQIENEYKGRM